MNLLTFMAVFFIQMSSGLLLPANEQPNQGLTKVWCEEVFVVQIDGFDYLVSESYVKAYNLEPTGKKKLYFAIEKIDRVPFLRSIDEETFRKHRDRTLLK